MYQDIDFGKEPAKKSGGRARVKRYALSSLEVNPFTNIKFCFAT